MSFPNKGNKLPRDAEGAFAAQIALALRRELGASRAAAKTVARWTGASERAAKNWLAGRYGPSGEHLVALARHSPGVLDLVLLLAGRSDLVAARRVAEALTLLRGVVSALERTMAHEDADAATP